jgi:hypothetical protein
MPQTIVTDREAEHRRETREWFKQRQRGMLVDAPSVAPEQQPYTFENGAPFMPTTERDEPFVPDRGFDGPA